MGVSRAPLIALALITGCGIVWCESSASSLSPPADPEPMRELVVQTATRYALHPGPISPQSALAARVASLGLRVVRSLADGESTTAAASDPRNPFDLDPARVWLLEAPDSLAARAAALELAEDPGIEWIEFNQRREPALAGLDHGFPDDPMFRDTRQWGLRNLGPLGAYGGVAGADIHALEAWARSTGSNHLLLAVADTGIDPDHPELQAILPDGSPRIVLGVNVTTDPATAYADSFGHGTPVVGVMAALTGEGAHFDSLGVAGVCGGDGRGNIGCRIVPIKIAPGSRGAATSFDIAEAMIYATHAGARAMNLSYAGGGPSRVERLGLYYAITRGCVVVAASGNKGASSGERPQYPAAYAVHGLCIQVGASDPFDRRAVFSSYGPGLDLVAPGVSIWTTYMTYPSAGGAVYDGYVAGSGTSFAAPHVTGVVGLLASARPELADADFQRVLRESADDIGDQGVDGRTGWGRLNAARALAAVDPAFGIWHDEVAAERFEPQSVDSLVVGESGPGTMDRIRRWPATELIEATATVSLPDSFLGAARIWPRVAGTMAVRPDFKLPYFAPWSEVAEIRPQYFTLRGYLYRLSDCTGCSDDGYLPLPPDLVRFGFTVIGRVDRPPTLEVASPEGPIAAAAGDTVELSWRASDSDSVTAIEVWLAAAGVDPVRLARLEGIETGARVALPCPAPFVGPGELRVVALDEHGRRHDRTTVAVGIELAPRDCPAPGPGRMTLRLWPNPSRGEVRILGPAGARVSIHDVAGRLVRRASLADGRGEYRWDGRESNGRAAPPGIYLVRVETARGKAEAKLLRLE